MKKIRESVSDYGQLILMLFVICLVFFALCLTYGDYQEAQFEETENKNLTADLLHDVHRIEISLTSFEGQIRAAAEMVAAADIRADEPWLGSYLKQLGSVNGCEVVYVPESRLLDYMAADEREQMEREGETMSRIRKAASGDGYLFSFCASVVRDGRFDGAIVCDIPADRLLRSGLNDDTRHSERFIVSDDGEIVYSSVTDKIGKNFVEELDVGGVSKQEIADCASALVTAEESTVSVGHGTDKVRVSSVALMRHDYDLVQITRESDMVDLSENLMRSNIFTAVVLVGVAIGASALVFRVFAQKNRRLRLQGEKFRAIASHFDTLLFEYDTQRDHLTFTINSTPRFFLDTTEIDHCREGGFDNVHPDDQQRVRDMFAEAKNKAATTEFRMQARNGKWVWCECRLERVESTENRVRIGQIMSIEERKQRELRLEKEKSTDPLTGLLRHEAFEREVGELLDGREGMFYFFDSNSLKKVNDIHGHDAGDELLRLTAGQIRRAFRASDPVSRRSGDEFLVYTAGLTSVDRARRKAEQVIAGVAGIDKFDGVRASIACGVARYPQDGRTFEELSKAADAAMYDAKRIGGHGDYCCFYGEEKTVGD